MGSAPNKTAAEKAAFADGIVSGKSQAVAYAEATGVDIKTASVQGNRWMKMPEIQERIQRKVQQKLIKAGVVSVDKLLAGLKAINPKKITGTSVKLIQLGMQMGGMLDKKIELSITETPPIAPEILAALENIGRQQIANAQELKQSEDGTYTVIDDPEPAGEPVDN